VSWMSHMADRDHIAITTGDKSTTTRKVSVLGCPVAPRIAVTQGDSSDTYSRIAPDSEIVPRRVFTEVASLVSTVASPSSVDLLKLPERPPPLLRPAVHCECQFAMSP
jgi:hypothetical protein